MSIGALGLVDDTDEQVAGGRAVKSAAFGNVDYVVLAIPDALRICFAMEDVNWLPGDATAMRIPANVARIAGWKFFAGGVDMPPEPGMPLVVTWDWWWAKVRGFDRPIPKIGCVVSVPVEG